MEHKNVSLADQVFERIESDILSGKYQRGEVLTESKLCEELGVSRTPIREAIRRLGQEHLIEESGKGSVVVGMSDDDVKNILFIRSKIEGECAALCADNATDEQIAELREVLELQEFYLTKSDPERIRMMDSNFHKLFYRFSGSAVFYDTLLPLHKKIQKYRKASVVNTNRAEKSVLEHKAIFEAIASHDREGARAAAEKHVVNAMESIIKRG